MKPQRGWINNRFQEAILNKIYRRKSFIILFSLLFTVLTCYSIASAGELTYSLHFGKPELRVITLYGENFTRVIMKGAVAIGEGTGKPEIQAAPVRLLLPQGSEVETLIDGNIEADYKTIQWKASLYSSGFYFYRLTARQGPGLSTAGGKVFTKRMTLVKERIK